MAVQGERSTSSYSSDFDISSRIPEGSSLAGTPKTDGPSWIRLQDRTWTTRYEQLTGPVKTLVVGYTFSGTLIFDPPASVAPGNYSYSWNINIHRPGRGDIVVGTVSGTETVTAPSTPPPPPETPTVPRAPVISISSPQVDFQKGQTADVNFTVYGAGASLTQTSGPGDTVGTGSSEPDSDGRPGTDYHWHWVIPSGASSGSRTVRFRAVNQHGEDTASITFNVIEPFPSIDIPTFEIDVSPGQSFRHEEPVNLNGWSNASLISDTSPSWFSVSYSDGKVVVEGTAPSDFTEAGNWRYTLRANYARRLRNQFVTDTFRAGIYITPTVTDVDTVPEWDVAPSGRRVEEYEFAMDISASRGSEPITYTKTSGPTWGNIQNNTRLTGTTPAVSRETDFDFGIRGTNEHGYGETTATVTVFPAGGDRKSVV